MRGFLTTIQRSRQANSRLKNENAKLREQVKDLKALLRIKDSELEDLHLRIDELEKIIFGSSEDQDKQNNDNDIGGSNNLNNETGNDGNQNSQPKPRLKSSYRRQKPSQSDITGCKHYSISKCPDCHSKLANQETVIRYEEDILLAMLNQYKKLKTATKQTIERGFCSKCRKWHSGKKISNQQVTLGPQVRQFVSYATYVLRLTYQQIKDILYDLYQFELADGEITNILNKTSIKLNPAYERLKQRVRGSPSVHLDETGWQTGEVKNYLWTMASGQTEEAIFVAGKNRGKGNAEKLLGKGFNSIRVTDFYAAYLNLPGKQQGCWSHLTRKARDLRDSPSLAIKKRKFISQIYNDLAFLYQQIQDVCQEDFNQKRREEVAVQLKAQFDDIIQKIDNYQPAPKKLVNLKNLMQKYRNQLFTCVIYKGVAPDNNKAERKLRHLVLKRKNSFGTKSEKGNQTFSINASVILSLWWQHKEKHKFFPKLNKLMQG